MIGRTGEEHRKIKLHFPQSIETHMQRFWREKCIISHFCLSQTPVKSIFINPSPSHLENTLYRRDKPRYTPSWHSWLPLSLSNPKQEIRTIYTIIWRNKSTLRKCLSLTVSHVLRNLASSELPAPSLSDIPVHLFCCCRSSSSWRLFFPSIMLVQCGTYTLMLYR